MDLKLKQALSLSLNYEFYFNKSILKIIENRFKVFIPT